MRNFSVFLLLPLAATATLSSCSSTGSSQGSRGGELDNIRTTAYTHTERDHRRYGAASAVGTPLKCGRVTSAAADWSRFPVGTRFRILDTNRVYEIDDYGSALVGTDTIDLYTPTRLDMCRWGVRKVDIEILSWGSPERSLEILRDRTRHQHVRSMVHDLIQQT